MMRLQKHFVSCLLLALPGLVLPGSAFAMPQSANEQSANEQPLTINVTVNKTKCQIAEPVEMKISILAPEGVKVRFPEIGRSVGTFEVRNSKSTLDIPTEGGRESVLWLELESLDAGQLEIPSIPISYVDRRGASPATGSQATTPQNITIRSSLEGVEDPTKDFRDIKDVVYIDQPPPANHSWLAWVGGVGGVLSLGLIAFMLVRRYRPNRTPKRWALNALQMLEQSSAFTDGDAEQVYLRVTGIVRSFVEKQFGISAPRLTTREFLEEVHDDNRLSPQVRTQLNEFLSAADMVKFAGFVPDATTLKSVVEQARELVERTTVNADPLDRGRQSKEAN